MMQKIRDAAVVLKKTETPARMIPILLLSEKKMPGTLSQTIGRIE